jgi:hypothetical protein
MKKRKVIVVLEIETGCPLSDLRKLGKWDDAIADTFAVSDDPYRSVKQVLVNVVKPTKEPKEKTPCD